MKSFFVVASFAVVSATATLSAKAPGPWRALFNGTDLTGWTQAPGRGGGPRAGASGAGAAPPAAPATPAAPITPAWKVENGVLIGGQAAPGMRGGSLQSTDRFKDFELELDFILAEHGSQCSAELVGPQQVNASVDKTCTYNSGITFRTGYQVNIGRREAGEFIGIVIHRTSPQAIRGNVLWLDTGDEKFPSLRKTEDWNHLQITANGPHITVALNGTKICDVTDTPTDPAEAKWKEAGPISIQWPPAGESGGFDGFVKYRNIRIREL